MTMPHFIDGREHHLAIPVKVEGTVQVEKNTGVDYTRAMTAEYGAWSTFVLSGTEIAQKILPRDPYRSRAFIRVTSLADAPPKAAKVTFGTQSGTQMVPAQGGPLFTGQTMEVLNQQELWMVPDGTNVMTVVLLVERWSDEHELDGRYV